MAAPLTQVRQPPPLYRLARAFRRLAVIVVILVAIYLATAGYSAYELVRSSPQNGGYAAGFGANDTVSVTGSFDLSNAGYYPLSGLEVSLRVLNASGVFLGNLAAGPVTLSPQSTTSFPFALYLPIAAEGPAASLLTTDQYLTVGFWGNATYAYLFPISVHFDQSKYWGAPFADLSVVVGPPTVEGGQLVVPLTISFNNHSDFVEDGSLNLEVVEASGASCGGTSLPVAVTPGGFFDQTTSLSVAASCSTSGAVVKAAFVGNGFSVELPPEALP